MTLRTKPGITVTVTKKADGQLVLNYTRSERTPEPSSRFAEPPELGGQPGCHAQPKGNPPR
jgi:hypothetical protein